MTYRSRLLQALVVGEIRPFLPELTHTQTSQSRCLRALRGCSPLEETKYAFWFQTRQQARLRLLGAPARHAPCLGVGSPTPCTLQGVHASGASFSVPSARAVDADTLGSTVRVGPGLVELSSGLGGTLV